MIHDPNLLDKLQGLDPISWEGRAYRFMFGGIQPGRANTRGARWNPPGVAAIYTALSRDTLLAELNHRLSLDSVKPRIPARLYTVEVTLTNVIDLSALALLEDFGLSKEKLTETDFSSCQKLGGAVAWLEHDGLLVPSARNAGTNLVIFPTSRTADSNFEVVDSEDLDIA